MPYKPDPLYSQSVQHLATEILDFLLKKSNEYDNDHIMMASSLSIVVDRLFSNPKTRLLAFMAKELISDIKEEK